MKKYQISPKFKRFNNKRSKDRQRRNSSRKLRVARRRKKAAEATEAERKSLEDRVTIHAPEVFSFINNPDSVCEFINSLENTFLEKKSVYVELSGVKSADHTAVTLMMAALVRFKSEGIDFNGNFPEDESIREFIRSAVGTLYQKNFHKKDEYVIHENNEFGVYTHAKKKVDSDFTAKLVLETSELVWDEKRRCPGVQSSLIELMHNTNNHADPEHMGEKHWWLSVNKKSDKDQTISYVFVDFGVGIIESLDGKPSDNRWYPGWKHLKSLWNSDAELLSKILAGELHRTVTDLSYRGKGLAHIAKAEERGNISNLCVISNKAYCNNKSGSVRDMSNSFSGTLVYWEVSPDNHSFEEYV